MTPGDGEVRQFLVRLPVDVYDRVKREAAAADLSMAQLVRAAVRRYLEDTGRAPKPADANSTASTPAAANRPATPPTPNGERAVDGTSGRNARRRYRRRRSTNPDS